MEVEWKQGACSPVVYVEHTLVRVGVSFRRGLERGSGEQTSALGLQDLVRGVGPRLGRLGARRVKRALGLCIL